VLIDIAKFIKFIRTSLKELTSGPFVGIG